MAELSPAERRERLVEVYREASECRLCPLHETRTKVVFGSGNSDADLMFVGEAPGAEEDRQGLPFVGRAGGLLTELLGGIGLAREDVFIANTLKCLRYTALVQLADGSWERIGNIVRSRFAGSVMSVDDDGRLVARRVTGWHATPVGDRSVFRLSYASAKQAGASKVAIQLTGDHPVLTERGYVPVEKLEAGDSIATGQGLSDLARDVVCGTVLGDGHLSPQSSHLFFAHSHRQVDYALFKAGLLDELLPRVEERGVAAMAGGTRTYRAVHTRTLAHPALRPLRDAFYQSRKRVPSWLGTQLNVRMLAIWFMDDGYTRIRPPRKPLAEIATLGFSDDDLQVLLHALRRLDLPAKAMGGRIYFDVPTTRRLCERIAPYVPPSMRYKLDPEVEKRVAFDPGRLRPGPQRTLFDAPEIEDVTDRMGADKTFFCIDVEGTHNFVTAGGVVHNCRPPGNRDPQPIEIETCNPYLQRQVDLIRPRVIGTLGNFATKLLTGSRVGITKVRGTPQAHEIGGVTLFVVPLLHPAAALRTPSLVDTLREDFAKLPALLEQEAPAPAPRDLETVPVAEPAEPAEPPADQLDLFG